ncbi:MAG: histidinol dehydrogenase [Acidobacteriaceae bacterium]|nr:histidinol dehydrogenase [Acidobacteriaceae bacterium]
MISITEIQDLNWGLSTERKLTDSTVEEVVRPIIEAVRREGDEALLRYAKRFDRLGELPLQVPESELAGAAESLSAEIRGAAETAIANIREFAQRQLPRECFEEFSPGRKLGWIIRPLNAVGCYVPSGRYPLPSTLLMTAVLAQSAGVPRICVTSPRPSKEILGCAHLLGIQEVYHVGGAQAIAAMAYGTETIQRVDRIVGPGNAYVAAAKKLLAGEVGIDFVAGPTEIMILAAEGDPKIIAADMLAQAEHDVTASAVFITTSRALANAVSAELERQLQTLPTRDVARPAIDNGSGIIVVPSMEFAAELANLWAPEHLSLHNPSLLPLIQNAGTVFLGQNSPESAGDYAAGPSHVLPTGGAARLRGGLSAADFVKIIAIQELSPAALKELAPTITTLARAEGLEAHARAVEVRSVS